jgi:hypothetical protein
MLSVSKHGVGFVSNLLTLYRTLPWRRATEGTGAP